MVDEHMVQIWGLGPSLPLHGHGLLKYPFPPHPTVAWCQSARYVRWPPQPHLLDLGDLLVECIELLGLLVQLVPHCRCRQHNLVVASQPLPPTRAHACRNPPVRHSPSSSITLSTSPTSANLLRWDSRTSSGSPPFSVNTRAAIQTTYCLYWLDAHLHT